MELIIADDIEGYGFNVVRLYIHELCRGKQLTRIGIKRELHGAHDNR